MKHITFPATAAADAFDTKLVVAEEDESSRWGSVASSPEFSAPATGVVLDPTMQRTVNQEWARLRSLEHGRWLAGSGFTTSDIIGMDAMQF